MWAQVVVLVPYWFTLLAFSWIYAFLYVWDINDAYVGYEKFVVQPVRHLIVLLRLMMLRSKDNCLLTCVLTPGFSFSPGSMMNM